MNKLSYCRWCKNTKDLSEMAVAGFRGYKNYTYSGVCKDCMGKDDWEEKEAAYLMEEHES